MSAEIIMFLPRARTASQERAFWKGPDRDAILRAGAVEIEQVRVLDSAPAELNPDKDSA